jgi:hypothetical protein
MLANSSFAIRFGENRAEDQGLSEGRAVLPRIMLANSSFAILFGENRVEDQGLSEGRAVPPHIMLANSSFAIWSLCGASRRGLQVTGGPGIVRIWWTVWCRTSRWTPVGRVSSGNSDSRVSTDVPPLITLMLGILEEAVWAGTDNKVTLSRRRLLRQSTRRPNKMWKKVGSNEGLSDVSHYKTPRKVPT